MKKFILQLLFPRILFIILLEHFQKKKKIEKKRSRSAIYRFWVYLIIVYITVIIYVGNYGIRKINTEWQWCIQNLFLMIFYYLFLLPLLIYFSIIVIRWVELVLTDNTVFGIHTLYYCIHKSIPTFLRPVQL